MVLSEGLDDKASCMACDFKGSRSDLFVHTFQSDIPIDPDQMVQRMSDDIAHRVMAVGVPETGVSLFAQALAGLLVKWGFAWWGSSAPKDAEEQRFRTHCTMRYAQAIGRGIVQALMETRVSLEKDRIEYERTRNRARS